MSLSLLSQQAREILGMPDNWHPYKFDSVRQGGENAGLNAPLLHFAITGLCCPLKSRGKNKGWPNYKKGDLKTERTAYITPAAEAEWRKQWESRTGKCALCQGKGQVVKAWNHITGSEYRPCIPCNGTGEAPDPAKETTANSPQG